jgi:RNA polymerase sigma-70 factor (ECF subfamily)
LEADLEAAVHSLDPRFRAALLLVDVHGLSYAECAVALDIPIVTVMSRLSRARARVRKQLQASGRFA